MDQTATSDAELVSRVSSGQKQEYAELVRRHHARILGLCVSMLGAAEADDAAQEIFLKAYQGLARFAGDSAFSTWLYRIASNHCLDLLRRRNRVKTESWDALLESEGERIGRLLEAPPDEQRRREDADLVERVLSCLPAEQRLALVLREVQGLSYEEIAGAMACSLDSVKARLRRARQDFADRLRHFLDPELV
ncbi:MAG: sigma-70 family RNA polymerase sigma factor [Elusimicrobia bacterium]|nr:sigma-70 family RNA polymerase sigma factor [Elusimicrobiota bacterium]